MWIVYGSNNNRISGKSADAHQLPGTRSSSRELLFEIRGVLLDEFLLVLWYVLKGMDRVGGASRHTDTADTAVNTAFRINVHLSGSLKARLVLLGMDAIGWAGLNAEESFMNQ